MIGYTDIRTVQQLHKGHWFDADTLRFWRSRFSAAAAEYNGGYLFVSSEKYNDIAKRWYSVRFCDSEGHITTVSDFQEYATGRQAWAAIHKLVKGV